MQSIKELMKDIGKDWQAPSSRMNGATPSRGGGKVPFVAKKGAVAAKKKRVKRAKVSRKVNRQRKNSKRKFSKRKKK